MCWPGRIMRSRRRDQEDSSTVIRPVVPRSQTISKMASDRSLERGYPRSEASEARVLPFGSVTVVIGPPSDVASDVATVSALPLKSNVEEVSDIFVVCSVQVRCDVMWCNVMRSAMYRPRCQSRAEWRVDLVQQSSQVSCLYMCPYCLPLVVDSKGSVACSTGALKGLGI